MKIQHSASAGVEGKEDVFVTVDPIDGENEVIVISTVKELYGPLIDRAGRDLLTKYKVESGCRLTIRDHNALDYVVRARIETAITRGMKG